MRGLSRGVRLRESLTYWRCKALDRLEQHSPSPSAAYVLRISDSELNDPTDFPRMIGRSRDDCNGLPISSLQLPNYQLVIHLEFTIGLVFMAMETELVFWSS